jgi:hypothetical protein
MVDGGLPFFVSNPADSLMELLTYFLKSFFSQLKESLDTKVFNFFFFIFFVKGKFGG